MEMQRYVTSPQKDRNTFILCDKCSRGAVEVQWRCSVGAVEGQSYVMLPQKES